MDTTKTEKTSTTEPASDGSSDYLLDDAFQSLLKQLPPVFLEPGDSIIEQNTASDAAYFLEAGTVGVFRETAYGPVPLATLQSPRLIGEIGVLTDLRRTASIKAVSSCVVYRIDRVLLREVGQRTPALLLSVIGQLGQQIDAVNKTIGVYTNALSALERREFNEGILGDLRNPPPQLREFSDVFVRFANQIRDKRKKQDELASGAIIQQSLLPSTDIGNELRDKVGICARMRPARDVGGDFFDYFMLDADRVAFCVGDVCGKGLPASLFMAVVVTTLRVIAREGGALNDVMARANEALCRGNTQSMFATVFFGVLDMRNNTLEYCNSGHPAAILVNSNKEFASLPTTGIPLGLFADRSPSSAKVSLKPDNLLILYSDGVTEASNERGEEFGEERLLQVARTHIHSDPSTTMNAIFAAVDGFSSGVEQSDDITCMVIAPRQPC